MMSFLPDTRASAEADMRIGVSFNFAMIIAVHLETKKNKQTDNVNHYESKSNDP